MHQRPEARPVQIREHVPEQKSIENRVSLFDNHSLPSDENRVI
jgi:hypothetical protein